jgi:hypothetical protein
MITLKPVLNGKILKIGDFIEHDDAGLTKIDYFEVSHGDLYIINNYEQLTNFNKVKPAKYGQFISRLIYWLKKPQLR